MTYKHVTAFTILITFFAILNAKEPIEPIPLSVDINTQKALLGKKLFHDTILSKDYTISCASCHSMLKGGADDRVVSIGVANQKGGVQSPTVFNSRYNFKQFWNGRADDLSAQAYGPIHNPVEQALDAQEAQRRLNNSEEYKEAFFKVYKTKKITFEQVIDAIVEFENALITPNAKFDKYLRGETKLSVKEERGYRYFKEFGCIACHNGINIGGNSYQKMGLINAYKYDEKYPDLYQYKHDERYKNVFKVPTLRNIALTAPYFHDASAKTLEDAIKTMSHHNLGFDLSQDEIDDIIAFLKSLTGEDPSILKVKDEI